MSNAVELERQSEAERAEREDGAVRSGVGLGGNGKQWQAMDTVLQGLPPGLRVTVPSRWYWYLPMDPRYVVPKWVLPTALNSVIPSFARTR